ncbi:hypothetical protein [Chloroflexus sp.]|uniref:hypothetical protein n=1 Tax=Chloroflexus sp. TaxID=1904827 RepID=UPI002ACE700C|nr:hypothetical protein [Chloroflexus sp.]
MLSDIHDIEPIASNTGIRERERLQKRYGAACWRKRKRIATIVLADGSVHRAELP